MPRQEKSHNSPKAIRKKIMWIFGLYILMRLFGTLKSICFSFSRLYRRDKTMTVKRKFGINISEEKGYVQY